MKYDPFHCLSLFPANRATGQNRGKTDIALSIGQQGKARIDGLALCLPNFNHHTAPTDFLLFAAH